MNLPMIAAEKDALIRKELHLVDDYIDSLQRIPGWQLSKLATSAQVARSSLAKVSALTGYNGELWRDLLLYIATLLPLLIPMNLALAATIFASLDSSINKILSTITMEPRVVQTTIRVKYWFFFWTTKTIEETVMVPVINYPHWMIPRIIAVLMVLLSLLAASWLLKKLWIREIMFRRDALERHWDSILKHSQ